MSYPTIKLGEICKVIKGKNPELFLDTGEGKIPYLTAKYIRGFQEPSYAFKSDKKTTLVCKSDIVIICDGSNSGETFIGLEGVLSSTMGKLTFNIEVNTLFINHFLVLIIKELKNRRFGAAIPHLDIKGLLSYKIPLPPLPTQKLIVQKLDSSFEKIDKSIELTKKNLANIEELNKSVLEEVFSNSDFKKVEIGEIITLNYGKGVDKKDKNEDGLYDVYGANGIMYKTNKFLFDGESIIIGRKGSAGALKRINGKFWASDVTYFVTINGKNDLDYIYNGLKFLNIPSLAQGVKPGINRNHVYELKIPLPPLQKQKEIVAHLDQVFLKNKALKETYQKKLKDLEEMKQSLLKEAFEGRLVKN